MERRRGKCRNQKQQWKALPRKQTITKLLQTIWEGETAVVGSPAEIHSVGHRVVHGGPDFEEPTLITPETKSAIAKAAPFAPLQNRAELEGMEIAGGLFPAASQVAVFDTGFHKTMPLAAAVYPGPYEWLSAGIRRYGFHGINHQYCSERAAELLRREPATLRLVSCHLGGGCSLAAIRGGKSVDTTMGFTPLEGLMMGTRSGSVDPGILIYLMRQPNASIDRLDDVLNRKSGLFGISGISDDMRQVLAAVRAGNAQAILAFDIYIHRLRSAIGSMVAVLDGIDALIFTAGVGENSSEVRAGACEGLRHIGLQIDPGKNGSAVPDLDIALPGSSVRVLVIAAQEDWQIAKACRRLTE